MTAAGNERVWRNVELEKSDAFAFRVFLISKSIKYESSGAGPLTHFEVFVNDTEFKEAEAFLSDTL